MSDCSNSAAEPWCSGGIDFPTKCAMWNAVCSKGISVGTKGTCGMNYAETFRNTEFRG